MLAKEQMPLLGNGLQNCDDAPSVKVVDIEPHAFFGRRFARGG
jgi:hypothetical protein